LKGKNTVTPNLKSNPHSFLKLERNHGSGYHGIKKDFPELKVEISYKKLKGNELTEAQKEYNKKLRGKRVVSEHTTGKMKKYGTMGFKFKNRPERYDTMTSIAGGFVNFRTENFSGSISTE